MQESIARGKLYTRAGADGLFLPSIKEAADIEAIVAAIAAPLNVMAWPGVPDAATLGQLGVRRLSAGSGITQTIWGMAEKLARDFQETGRSAPLSDASKAYGEMQALFARA